MSKTEEELRDLGPPNREGFERVRDLLAKVADNDPDKVGSLQAWDLICRTIESSERFMLEAAIDLADAAGERGMEEAVRRDLLKGLIGLVEDRESYEAALMASGLQMPAAMFVQYVRARKEQQFGLLGFLAQLVVLYARDRRQKIRIAELELQITELQQAAGGEPPVVEIG